MDRCKDTYILIYKPMLYNKPLYYYMYYIQNIAYYHLILMIDTWTGVKIPIYL